MRLATMYWAGRVWVVLGSAATGLRAEEVMRVRADLLLDQRLHVALSARRTLMLLDVPASDVGCTRGSRMRCAVGGRAARRYAHPRARAIDDAFDRERAPGIDASSMSSSRLYFGRCAG